MAWGNKVINSQDIRNGTWKTFERLFGGSQKGSVAGTGVRVTEGAGKTVFTFTNASVATVDATTSGAGGGLKIYDFPEGAIFITGAVANLTISAAAGITTTAAVVGSVGTVTAGADATLTSTEANIIPSTASPLTASAGTFSAVNFTNAGFDGTAAAISAFLNFAIPDAGSSANSTITVNGTLTINWQYIADK